MAICIAGHAGIGHVCTHSGFVQDDSQGFAVVADLLCRNFGIDPTIAEAAYETQTRGIRVKLKEGGEGVCAPARGVTPFERDLLERLEGENSCYPQRAAMKTFGRMYGHGVTDTAAGLEYAIAEALMDAFAVTIDGFVIEKMHEQYASDIVGGVPVELEGSPIVALLTVNGSHRGVGPNEDLEGNVALSIKKTVMERLGILSAPTIIVESKAFNPSLADIERETLLLRYNRKYDNTAVAEAVEKAFESISETTHLSHKVIDSAFSRYSGAMKKNLDKYVDELFELVERLRASTTAEERVEIGEKLSRITSQEYGGIIFMSNSVNEVVGAAGLMPGTGVVLSTVVPRSSVEENIIPYSTEVGIGEIQRVLKKAITYLNRNIEQAEEEVRDKYEVPKGP